MKSKCDLTKYILTEIIIFVKNQNKIEQSQRTEENALDTHASDLLCGVGSGQWRHRG